MRTQEDTKKIDLEYKRSRADTTGPLQVDAVKALLEAFGLLQRAQPEDGTESRAAVLAADLLRETREEVGRADGKAAILLAAVRVVVGFFALRWQGASGVQRS